VLSKFPAVFDFYVGHFRSSAHYVFSLKMNLFYKIHLQAFNLISIVLYHSVPTFGKVLYSCLDAFVVDAYDYSGHLIRHLINASEAFPTEWFLQFWAEPTRLWLVPCCDKAQWRLHWRPVNVFCKINSFLKRKHTECTTSEMTHVHLQRNLDKPLWTLVTKISQLPSTGAQIDH
jgi:hypothetical protein